MMEQGKSDADVMTAARTEVTQMAVKLLPLATNETLVAYANLLYEQILYISKADTNACVEMIFPSNVAISSASFLSNDLQKRELDLMYRVVDEADHSRAIKVSDEQVGAAIGPLLANLSDGELAAMGSKEARDKDIEVACSAAVKYLGALSRLPLSTKARTFRIIYAGN